jgi:thiazole/oxazole-forming peptide maturase SagD family component
MKDKKPDANKSMSSIRADPEADVLVQDDVVPFGEMGFKDERELILGWDAELVINEVMDVANISGVATRKEALDLHIEKLAMRFLNSKTARIYIRSGMDDVLPLRIGKIVEMLDRMGYPIGELGRYQRFNDIPRFSHCIALCGKNFGLGAKFSYESALLAAISEALERSVFKRPKPEWFMGAEWGCGSQESFREVLDLVAVNDGNGVKPIRDVPSAYEGIRVWVRVRDALKEKDATLPAQLIFYGHLPHAKDFVKIVPRNSNGCAAGGSFDDAFLRAILELIERDAFVICWMRKIVPPRVAAKDVISDVRFDPKLRQLLDDLARYRFDVSLLMLPTDFPVQVCCCVLRDTSGVGPVITVGLGADMTIGGAISKAVLEAIGMYQITRIGSKLPDKLETLRGEIKGTIPPSDLGPYGRVKLWGYRLEMADKIEWFLNGPNITLGTTVQGYADSGDVGRNLRKVMQFIRQKGFHCFSYSVPEEGLRRLGFWFVRAVIPELVPLHLFEREVCLYHPRLRMPPSEFGPVSAEQWNSLPHPFP